jgi:solute carrier family 45 protein 1/2/4
MSPTVIAAVWIAGPITGTLFQPYIGAISDASRHPWGRRKFYIVTGTVSTIVSIILLRQSIEIGTGLAQAWGAEPRGEEAHWIAQAVAILAINFVGFTTCPLQAGLRAFIVESCPSHQQEEASAWVCRFVGIGSMMLYALGYVSLPAVAPWLGDTQFKALCSFTCLALGSTVATTCIWIKEERPPIPQKMLSEKPNGLGHPFREIYKSARGLSSRTKRTMLVQACAWYSWFTFLYYITS